MKLLGRRDTPPSTDAPDGHEHRLAEVTSMIEAGQRARLGDVLVAENLITPEQVAAALNLQQASGRQLGSILVDQGVIDPRVLTRALAAQLGLPTIDLRREAPSDDALDAVDEATARPHPIVPMRPIDGVPLDRQGRVVGGRLEVGWAGRNRWGLARAEAAEGDVHADAIKPRR